MVRYILIDNCSGYIWGDSAEDGKLFSGTPIDYATVLDSDIGLHCQRTYEEVSRHALASNESGYHVFRVDGENSEIDPVIQDGQDRETIRAVWDNCEYVTAIRCVDETV